jgi:hypothetical protein
MAAHTDPLDQIKVATPCTASWGKMTGDDRVRFCNQCDKNVYHLSAMTRKEALDLVNRTEGKICVRYYERRDGTILTDDCPVGLRLIRRQVARAAGIVFFAVTGLFAWGMSVFASSVPGKEAGRNKTEGKSSKHRPVRRSGIKVHATIGMPINNGFPRLVPRITPQMPILPPNLNPAQSEDDPPPPPGTKPKSNSQF